MNKRAARPKRSRSVPKRAESRGQTKAWRAAEDRYARMQAEAMVPFFGTRPTRDEQIGRLEQIVRGCPTFYPAIFHLGTLQAISGRPDEGRRLLLEGADRMAEREPSLPEGIDEGGLIDNLTGNLCYDLARDLLERLLEHYPSEAWFHAELGHVLVVLGEPDEAVRRFERAVELEPEDGRLHGNLGWACLAAGRLDEAKTHLERSLGLAPQDEVAHTNLQVLRFLQRKGGTFEDYLLRPLDRKALDRLERKAHEEGDFEELDEVASDWSYARLEAWKWELCRRREPPDYAEVFKSIRAFFQFFEGISQDSYLLYEDLGLVAGRFERVMHKLIFRMADADAEILGEIFSGLLSFYGFLCEHGLVDEDDLAEFRSEVSSARRGLVEKAERYAEIRHDDSIDEEEKEEIRQELFQGDHEWPVL